MSSVLGVPLRVLCLVLAMLFAGSVHGSDQLAAADVQLAALSASGGPAAVPDIRRPPAVQLQMTKPPQVAQARCPSGLLVFLSRACGCNGACCRCSREARYLNHCTCQCEAVPTACAQGHSAGNP